MISAATIQALEERKLEYLLGARERGTAVIRDIVLAGETPPFWVAVPFFTSGCVLFHGGTADVRESATGWTAET
jgi:hypothetical protein